MNKFLVATEGEIRTLGYLEQAMSQIASGRLTKAACVAVAKRALKYIQEHAPEGGEKHETGG